MISLILPYWRRQAAATQSLRLMAGHYGPDVEVIVVDDGSGSDMPHGNHLPFVVPTDLVPNTLAANDSLMTIRTLYLLAKDRAMNSCVPYNRGAAIARGEFIALSSPEMLHVKPVLYELAKSCVNDNDYVLGACYSDEQDRWHCHSSIVRSNGNDVGAWLPPGADYHFMSLMRRTLWDRIGGLDEDYREGAGYDDPDLVRRLHAAGANFVRRDDLVVVHPRRGAHSEWTAQGFARNRALFMSKWKPLRDVAA